MNRFARALLVIVLAYTGTFAVTSAPPAAAGIDTQSLGGRYTGTGSNVTFRVYSSRATRIAVIWASLV